MNVSKEMYTAEGKIPPNRNVVFILICVAGMYYWRRRK